MSQEAQPATAHLATLDHIDQSSRTQIEAAAFRSLVAHLQWRTDAQNIDLMGIAGFCRNCMSKWLREAAIQAGTELTDADARHAVYGLPYSDWKATHQGTATAEQKERFSTTRPLHAKHPLLKAR